MPQGWGLSLADLTANELGTSPTLALPLPLVQANDNAMMLAATNRQLDRVPKLV
jgi:hypothetical protein